MHSLSILLLMILLLSCKSLANTDQKNLPTIAPAQLPDTVVIADTITPWGKLSIILFADSTGNTSLLVNRNGQSDTIAVEADERTEHAILYREGNTSRLTNMLVNTDGNLVVNTTTYNGYYFHFFCLKSDNLKHIGSRYASNGLLYDIKKRKYALISALRGSKYGGVLPFTLEGCKLREAQLIRDELYDSISFDDIPRAVELM